MEPEWAPPAKRPKTEVEGAKATAATDPGQGAGAKATAATDQGQDVEVNAAESSPEEPKVPEPSKELEEDAPPATGSRNKEGVTFLVRDTTLNVLPSTANNLLMTLGEGGIQHFMAGARANIGVKSGRYMFEVKVLELVQPLHEYQNQVRTPPKNLLRVGFSTASSDLILGEGEESLSFDSHGNRVFRRTRVQCASRFERDAVVAVLLNLEEGNPNFNTMSLFVNGKRASEPQALPDPMKGKLLYPTLTFKNMTVHTNFGSTPLAPLPFKCHMIQDAAKAACEVTKAEEPKDGKYEVLFPISLPDEGTFDWLDMFLEKNPQYTELSDRMIVKWAEKSGLWRAGGYATKCSNDKPEHHFGIRELDDGSVRRVLNMIATVQRRHFVVMEVRGNLVKEERMEVISRFPAPSFKKVGRIILGEPSREFKNLTHAALLKDKQAASDLAFRKEQMVAKHQREVEKAKRRAEREVKKAALAQKNAEEQKKAEERKKADEQKKAEEGENEKKEGTDGDEKEENANEPKANAEEEKDEDEEEDQKMEDKVEDPPTVELSAEEKETWFKKVQIPDLTPLVLNTSFTKFSLPDKDEGLDEVTHDWFKSGSKCQDHLKQWIIGKKLTTRVDDLVPGSWFHGKLRDWNTTHQGWRQKQMEYKTVEGRKRAVNTAKEAAKNAKMAEEAAEAAEKEKDEAEAKAEESEQGKNTEEGEPATDTNRGKEKEKELGPDPMSEEPNEKTVDFAGLDVFGVDDVLNIGDGSPLFKEFEYEDWALAHIRFELHLLVHAFRHDIEDPDRAGITLEHLAFYYHKYYKTMLSTMFYGVETLRDVVELVSDTIHVNDKGVIASMLPDEMETFQVFIKLAEAARRHRQIRVDMGEEAAVLHIQQPVSYSAPQAHWQQQRQGHWTPPNSWQVHEGGPNGQKGGRGQGKWHRDQNWQGHQRWQGSDWQGGSNGGDYHGKGGQYVQGVQAPRLPPSGGLRPQSSQAAYKSY